LTAPFWKKEKREFINRKILSGVFEQIDLPGAPRKVAVSYQPSAISKITTADGSCYPAKRSCH
jgi:hypothetical protein